jgi:lycopene cyclase domain-containing protein
MKSTYLLIDLFTILVPFLFTFHQRIQFYKQWRSFFPAMLITAAVFITWDAYFTSIGVWNFNPEYTLGIHVLGLPIEELLFFICVPYSCVFTYYCLDKFYRLDWSTAAESATCIAISLILVAVAIIHIDKIYTSVTFLTTATLCLLLKFVAGINWFGKAISVYLVLLIPFMIVNGLLTGTGLNDAVVRYNDNENMGLRILTIPIEDTVYGFELYLLNLSLYHLIKQKAFRPDLQKHSATTD